jgi:hypothetical protein
MGGTEKCLNAHDIWGSTLELVNVSEEEDHKVKVVGPAAGTAV